ncbi:MAG: YafY family transcriptional regulator [Planctomycetaceae bacterium]|nr:YafY family transcriptional regulator [Planctomycetaceae bacterium]
MNLAKIHRLLQLIGLLQAGRGYNADALAQACGVSRRTVFRDVDLLRQSGVPVAFDELQQCYRIPGACLLPPTNFTPEEAMALLVLCHELGDGRGLPFLGPARSAAVKLESTLPARLRDQLRNVTAAVQIQPPPSNPLDGCEPVYEQLLAAIANRRSVRIRYDSLKEQKQLVTRLSPYRLFFSRRSWYVVGRSSIHRSKRTFHLGRIMQIEPLDDHFEVPRGFSIERYLRNAWHMIPEQGRDSQVVVRFSDLVAQNVAEVHWHRTQRVEYREDGTLDFHVTVSGLNEISWWILGYGDQAEVLEPPELRRLVAERARRMVEKYT